MDQSRPLTYAKPTFRTKICCLFIIIAVAVSALLLYSTVTVTMKAKPRHATENHAQP